MSFSSELGLEDFPVEILFRILRSIPELPDLLAACSTSRALQSICKSDSFWRERFQQDFGHSEEPEEGGTWEELYRLLWNIRQRVPKFSVGPEHAGIIYDDGYLYMMGSNRYGQLGMGISNERNINTSGKIKIGEENKRVIQVSCGEMVTAAITEDGQVWTWGNNFKGILGLGLQERKNIYVPTQVSQLAQPASKIDVGEHSMITMTKTGDVYLWGQLSGYDNTVSLVAPSPVKLELPEKAVDVACGYNICAAIGESGKLYFWESKDYLYMRTDWSGGFL
jgi:hypothetical protein